jgi:iron complex outermembrane receptor protein
VKLSFGAEYRTERSTGTSEALRATLVPTFSASEVRRRDVQAVYGELLIPIVGEGNSVPAIHQLQASLAGRYERYSDFGGTSNPKIGITWSPVPDLRLRGSWSTSFQAPTLLQLSTAGAAYAVFPLADPQAPSGQTLALIYFAGGNPELEPQAATTWSLGADLQPRWIPGLRTEVNYFRIDYTNLISSIGLDLLNALTLESLYGSLITRNPDAAFVQAAYESGLFQGVPIDPSLIGAFVDGSPNNLGVLRQSGIDLLTSYQFEAGFGRVGMQASVTWLFDYKVAPTPAAEAIERLDTVNNPVDLRIRGGLSWVRDGWSANAFVNYVDGYKNNAAIPAQEVDAWTTVDLRLAHQWREFTVSLQAQNLFDADPPFVNSSSYGYDPSAASPIGRFVSLQIRAGW